MRAQASAFPAAAVMRFRVRGPETIKELAVSSAASGVLLFLVLLGIALRNRDEPPPSPDVPEGLELLFPVPGVSRAAMSNGFGESRGQRTHHAVDILAPRHSPVVAVADGSVARLWRSESGGISIHQFDRSGRYCYYYAHLQAYASGLAEGQNVKRGQVLGYVGTTGNAPPATPHLHFAIFLLTTPNRGCGGRPIDPYPLWP
jgi:murein DD-endopeptidase MepM/ murein hydrolase activator NlpD